MIAGYHTAGLLLHDPIAAIDELAHLGFGSVAIRAHAATFHPDAIGFGAAVLRLSDVVRRTGVRLVIDLNGRFLHDPHVAQSPSLVDADDAVCETARGWIERWIDVADEVGASVLTFGCGRGEVSQYVTDEENLNRLTNQLNRLITNRPDRRVALAIRPAVGDVIGSVARYERLVQWLGGAGEPIGLAADVGEMLSAGEIPVADRLTRQGIRLQCVYLNEKSAGRVADSHVHVDLGRIVYSLRKSGFGGPGIVTVDGRADAGLGPARESIDLFD